MSQLFPTVLLLKYPAKNVTYNPIFHSSMKSVGSFRCLMVLFLLFTFNFSFGQDLNRKITIKVKNKPIVDVLNEISEQGQIYFSYNPQIIPADKKITIKAINISIKEVLSEVLIQNGLDYSVVENQVVLKKQVADKFQHETRGLFRPEKHTISGFIKESSTGEVLIGANVYAQGTSLGTTSNGYGFYSLTLPEGNYRMIYSYIGYLQKLEEINLGQDISNSVELAEVKTEIKEVEISAIGLSSDSRNNQLSELAFSHRTLAQLPGFAGDLDIIRALQVVPGIQTFGDGSSLYYVRGRKQRSEPVND